MWVKAEKYKIAHYEMKRIWNGGIHQEDNTWKVNGEQEPVPRYYSILVELTK